jgi:hypothetical protein
MVTPDEQRSLQLKNAKADEQFWTRLHELYEERVSDRERRVRSTRQNARAASAS